MKQNKLIAIDLAKNVFQAGIFNKNRQLVRNKSFSRNKLKALLINTDPCIVVMEACGSAHYWSLQKSKVIRFI